MITRYKFPRTPHVSWSPGFNGDDIRLANSDMFTSMKEVIITEKLDGENSTIYSDGFVHARSIDSSSHPSRSWVKQYASAQAQYIPDGWRVCGENVYGIHSIEYTGLPTFFFVFSIVDDTNTVLSWNEIEQFCQTSNFQTTPVLYRGPWDEKRIKTITPTLSQYGAVAEGYVIRNANRFSMSQYDINVAKYVRENHVQTDEHWTASWRRASLKKS